MKKSAAFFDVDRTLLPRHTMERMLLPYLIRKGFVLPTDLLRYVFYFANGRGGHGQTWHENKQHLKDKPSSELERLAGQCFDERIKPRISQAGRRAVKSHQEAGHLVVLVTGTLMPLARAMQKELGADMVLATQLDEDRGRLSGALANRRPYGREKARLVKDTARQLSLDLKDSYAYGDHRSDVHLLAAVGNPRAVNPDASLRQEARRRGWQVLSF